METFFNELVIFLRLIGHPNILAIKDCKDGYEVGGLLF